MIIESIGLDVDDVVFDTFPNVTRRVQETARIMGLEPPNQDRITEVYDYGAEMAKTLFPGADVDEFLRIAGSLDFPYELLDGAKEALDFLLSSGRRTWLFTGSRKNITEEKFAHTGISPIIFYLVLTHDATRPYRKPDRNAWQKCARELQNAGIDPRRSLYVEDGLENYHRAREIGLQAVLLLGSPNSRGYQGQVPPEDILPSMRQFPELAQRRGLVLSKY